MRTITVHYHTEDASWWADSPDVEGFTAVADSFDELRPLVRQGVSFALDGEPFGLDERTPGGEPIINALRKAQAVFKTTLGDPGRERATGDLGQRPASGTGIRKTVDA